MTGLAVLVTSKDFNPELYLGLAELLSLQYKASGDATQLVQTYLSLFVKGIAPHPSGRKFQLADYPARSAFLQGSLKELASVFGIEVVVLYTAMILKRRVAILCPSVDRLLQIGRAMPQLVYQRQDWSILHPLVDSVSSGRFTWATSMSCCLMLLMWGVSLDRGGAGSAVAQPFLCRWLYRSNL